MTGKVTRIRKRGVEVQMDDLGVPNGSFVIISQTSGAVLGHVEFRKVRGDKVNFNWNPVPDDVSAVQIGDTLQPG